MLVRQSRAHPSSGDHVGGYLHQRRRFLRHAAAIGIAAFSPGLAADCVAPPGIGLRPGDKLNTYAEITTYNNFYEYSPDKRAVAHLGAEPRRRGRGRFA